MNREAVIDEMVEVINTMNRELAWSQGIPSDQIEQLIVSMQQELRHGNGMIYDKLVELDVIKED